MAVLIFVARTWIRIYRKDRQNVGLWWNYAWFSAGAKYLINSFISVRLDCIIIIAKPLLNLVPYINWQKESIIKEMIAISNNIFL